MTRNTLRKSLRQGKKAQIPSQAFMYILTMIIIGLMFYLSVKWIGGIWSKGKQIDIVKLKTSIEESFESIKPNYGSWEDKSFNVGSDTNKVCFFDTNPNKILGWKERAYICKTSPNPSQGDPIGNPDDYDPIACDAWIDGKENIIFDPMLDTPVYIEDVKVDDGYICFNVSYGRIEVRLEGLGNAVRVSRP